MTYSRLKYLTWTDILVLTLLLFGMPIYNSTQAFLSPALSAATPETSISTYTALVNQGVTLLIAFFYLNWRGFDFSQWQIKPSLRAAAIGLLIFLALAGLMDVYYWLFNSDYRAYILTTPINFSAVMPAVLQPLNPSTVLYAILNGIYEESYFIGMCLFVKKEQRRAVWLFSLMVRISFHTYQGLQTALGIGLILGIFYYIWFEQLGKKNLFPIFMSHALADIWGLAILYYWFLP